MNKKTKHTIVFLHGWSSKVTSWDKQVSFFKNHGYKVVVIPLPGFDLDEPPTNWGIPEYAEYVIGKLPSKTEKYIFVGHSFGGRISTYIVCNYPNRVKAIVLADAAGLNLESHPGRQILIKVSGVVKRLESILPFVSVFRDMVRKFTGSEGYKSASPVMRKVMKNVVNFDLQDCLPNIKVQTLIIWGEKDKVTPLNMAKAFSEGIQDSSLEIVENAGHAPHRTHSKKWNELVLKFVTQI